MTKTLTKARADREALQARKVAAEARLAELKVARANAVLAGDESGAAKARSEYAGLVVALEDYGGITTLDQRVKVLEAEAADANRKATEKRIAESVQGERRAVQAIEPAVEALAEVVRNAMESRRFTDSLRRSIGEPVVAGDLDAVIIGALVRNGILDPRAFSASLEVVRRLDSHEQEAEAVRAKAQAEADRAAEETRQNDPTRIIGLLKRRIFPVIRERARSQSAKHPLTKQRQRESTAEARALIARLPAGLAAEQERELQNALSATGVYEAA
jgi:hypothetical protein